VLDEKVKNRIALQLKNTRLKQFIGQEIAALLLEKPEEIDAEEYCHEVAGLVVRELRERICAADDHDVPGIVVPESDPDDPTPDLDRVIRRLASGVEYALLSGNLQMVRALGEAIAKRDSGGSSHTPRVTLYAIRLAEHIRLDQERIQALIKGAFLHDIGKIGIRDDILLKRGGLSDEERFIMNGHTELGAQMIKGVKWLEDALDVVRHHHERFDGSGYPDALKEHDIPLNARIFSVVDVFYTLTSSRPYKEAFSFQRTLEIIESDSGTHFDPAIIKAFSDIAPSLYAAYSQESYEILDARLRHSMAVHFGIDTHPLS
jgi:putative nucleotidyltransferase with HDIG domain